MKPVRAKSVARAAAAAVAVAVAIAAAAVAVAIAAAAAAAVIAAVAVVAAAVAVVVIAAAAVVVVAAVVVAVSTVPLPVVVVVACLKRIPVVGDAARTVVEMAETSGEPTPDLFPVESMIFPTPARLSCGRRLLRPMSTDSSTFKRIQGTSRCPADTMTDALFSQP